MASLDGVKAPPSHSVRSRSSEAIKKKRPPEIRSHSSRVRKPIDEPPHRFSHLTIEERKKIMWIGITIVFAAVVGVWIWLLPSSLSLTAGRTDTSDWEKLKKGLGEAVGELQNANLSANENIDSLRQNVFGDNQNVNGTESMTNANENTNIENTASE